MDEDDRQAGQFEVLSHLTFLESVRDEVHYAADAKRQQLEREYTNATIKSMVGGIHWREAADRAAALVPEFGAPARAVADVTARQLTAGTVDQIDDLLQPAVRELRDAWERSRTTAVFTCELLPPRSPIPSDGAIMQAAVQMLNHWSNDSRSYITGKRLVDANSARGDNVPIGVCFPVSHVHWALFRLWETGRLIAAIPYQGFDENPDKRVTFQEPLERSAIDVDKALLRPNDATWDWWRNPSPIVLPEQTDLSRVANNRDTADVPANAVHDMASKCFVTYWT